MEAEDISRKIMREQPRHHDFVLRNLALSLMQQQQFDEAADIHRGIVALDVRDVRLKRQALTDLVVLAKLAGDEAGFNQAKLDLLKLAPDFTIALAGAGIMDRSGKWKTTYLSALRAAGLPKS